MIWFTSDLHFGHEAAIRMCGRPFKNADEMNKTIIDNINAVVKQDDTLYILGDICHRISIEKGDELINQIKCKNKILIKGNHDKNWNRSLFTEIRDFKEISYSQGDKHYSISLMHYPMLEWPKSFHGSIHLHGHCHNKPEYNQRMKKEGTRRYDVGVDANNFKPVSITEILKFIEEKEYAYMVNPTCPECGEEHAYWNIKISAAEQKIVDDYYEANKDKNALALLFENPPLIVNRKFKCPLCSTIFRADVPIIREMQKGYSSPDFIPVGVEPV